jgi:hypothetical protein
VQYEGFATPYYAPNLYTNTGSLTITNSGQWDAWSVNWTDRQRYMRVIWTLTNGNTNGSAISAIWLGPRIFAP